MYPKIIIMQDGPFSDLHKADVPLALCMHLTEKGLSFREVVLISKVWIFLAKANDKGLS